jgi:aryl-alcohol dehydrogenase-like predicted oxidoreductase
VTFWDTPTGYGDNEALIDKWFKLHAEPRQDIVLTTKFGLGAKIEDGGKNKMLINSSPENCREACEQSLRNLGVDCIDLFYVHRLTVKRSSRKPWKISWSLKGE